MCVSWPVGARRVAQGVVAPVTLGSAPQTGKLAANPRGAPGGGVQGWGTMDPFWPLSMMQGGETAPGYPPHHLPHHPTMPVDLHVTQPHYQYYRWAPSPTSHSDCSGTLACSHQPEPVQPA